MVQLHMKSHLGLGGKGEGSKPRLRSKLRTCLALKIFKTEETVYLILEPKVERIDKHFLPFCKQNSIKWLASAKGGVVIIITYKHWACLCQKMCRW